MWGGYLTVQVCDVRNPVVQFCLSHTQQRIFNNTVYVVLIREYVGVFVNERVCLGKIKSHLISCPSTDACRSTIQPT